MKSLTILSFFWKCYNLWWLPPGVCELCSLLAIFHLRICQSITSFLLNILRNWWNNIIKTHINQCWMGFMSWHILKQIKKAWIETSLSTLSRYWSVTQFLCVHTCRSCGNLPSPSISADKTPETKNLAQNLSSQFYGPSKQSERPVCNPYKTKHWSI